MFSENNSLLVFPNPNNGKFTVGFDEEIHLKSFVIIDGKGEVVYCTGVIKSSSIEINLVNKSSGTYYLEATNGVKKYTQKIVVMK